MQGDDMMGVHACPRRDGPEIRPESASVANRDLDRSDVSLFAARRRGGRSTPDHLSQQRHVGAHRIEVHRE
jgi:hypothetical protein